MLMQKKKKKKVEKKDKVSFAILHCILRFVTYVTKPNCFGSSFFLGVCLIEYGLWGGIKDFKYEGKLPKSGDP